MKNNKGFTLVEILAVVAILITVIGIIIPKIFKHFKNSEDIIEKEQINELINISKIYTNQNTNRLPDEDDISIITLSELKDSGLVKSSQILNPKTKEELTGCILVKYENNKYKYEYKEQSDLITVTFDPNGGNVDKTSKIVAQNEPYGLLPTPTRYGYKFVGWSTSQTDTNIIYDDNEYYEILPSDSSLSYKNIKEFLVSAPFEENDVYQLDVDIKGEGQLINYFYGETNFLKVKRVETIDNLLANGDGSNTIILNNEYKHYTVRFTLGNDGDGSVNKKLLFRVYKGNTAYIKNIRLTKVSQSSTIYTEKNVKNNKLFDNSNLVTRMYEYSASLESDASDNMNLWQINIYPPFSENDIYQLDVDVKGEGTIKNYFYGATGYLQVEKVENSQGNTYTYGDGANIIYLTDDYQHYTATFTLGNNGDGWIVKYLLFRLYPGNTAYIKNIEFKKIYPEEPTDGTSKTLYAIWRANS